MKFDLFKTYLEEAGLYETLVEQCQTLNVHKVSWDMLLHVPETFTTDHYSNYLKDILRDIDKKINILPDSQNSNYDLLVFICWILFFLKRGKDRYYEKELKAIKADEKKGFEESDKKKTLDAKSVYFDTKYNAIVQYIKDYQTGGKELTPDNIVTIYRELACMYKWKSEKRICRPDLNDIKQVRVEVIWEQVTKETPDKKNINKIGVKERYAELQEKFNGKSTPNPSGISKDEIKHIKLMEYQMQEISEYLRILNTMCIVCTEKYFHEEKA